MTCFFAPIISCQRPNIGRNYQVANKQKNFGSTYETRLAKMQMSHYMSSHQERFLARDGRATLLPGKWGGLTCSTQHPLLYELYDHRIFKIFNSTFHPNTLHLMRRTTVHNPVWKTFTFHTFLLVKVRMSESMGQCWKMCDQFWIATVAPNYGKTKIVNRKWLVCTYRAQETYTPRKHKKVKNTE